MRCNYRNIKNIYNAPYQHVYYHMDLILIGGTLG